MKKTAKKSLALLAITLMILIFMVGCGNANKEYTEGEASWGVDYRNEELGFRFSYPEDMDTPEVQEVDGLKMVMAKSLKGSGAGRAVSVIVEPLPASIFTIKQYQEVSMAGIEQGGSVTKDQITTEESQMAGVEAFTFEYEINGVKKSQCAVIKDGKGYIITYGAPTSKFNEEEKDNIIKSFGFIK